MNRQNPTAELPLEPTISQTVTTFEVEDPETQPDPEEEYPDGGIAAYAVVAGSFLGLICSFGMMNAISAIQGYISIHQLAHVSTATVSWIFSIYLSISFGGALIIGPLFDLWGCRWLLTLGTILMFISFLGASFCYTVPQFILSLSIGLGFATALCVSPLIGVISHWFLVQRGTAISLATVGGSIGGCVIPILLRSLYPRYGYGWTIRILGFFCLGLMTLSVLLTKSRFVRPLLDSELSGKRQKMLHLSKTLIEFLAFKDLTYVALVFANFFTELALMCALTYYTSYSMANGASESSSYVLLTIFNAMGIPGRYIGGVISDKIGYFNVMIIMNFGFNLCFYLLWIPFPSNVPVLYAFSVLCGFFSSSVLSTFPACLGAITPVNKFGLRYGMVYSVVSVVDLFGIPMAGAVIGSGTVGHYQMFAVLCACLATVGLAFYVFSRYRLVGMRLNVKI